MSHDLVIRRAGMDAERITLRTPMTAGGSRADAISIRGVPPGALRLLPCATGVVVEVAAGVVRVGGRVVPPGARRLLRIGERTEIPGAELSLEPPACGDGTRVIAAALLRDAAAGAAPVSGPALVVLTGPSAGARHPLGLDQTIGRGAAATIAIHDPRASRMHARIRIEADGVVIEDLGSKNGVRVNGTATDRRPCRISSGDEVAIGDTAFALEDGAATSVADSSPAPARAPRRGARAHEIAAVLLAACAAALALAS